MSQDPPRALEPAAAAVTTDPWVALAGRTPARLALGRAGAGLPTDKVLDLALAHARARDAVHAGFDTADLASWLATAGIEPLDVESAAATREIYLRRPDFGRRLSVRSRKLLEERPRGAHDVAIVVADGLSATAVVENARPLLEVLLPALHAMGLGLGPVCLVRQGRVALGDEIGALLNARLLLMLIGERPGLSAADSLGAYLTFAPRLGRTDAERNCVSNIRPAGLPPPRAATTIAWLVDQAFRLALTGVGLKDDSGLAILVRPADRVSET